MSRKIPFDLVPLRNMPRQCGFKVKHRDRKTALAHAKALNDPDVTVYCCPWCMHWHVGHSKDTRVTSA